MSDLIQLPSAFYVDHSERDLPTPRAVRWTKRHVWVQANDPALDELLNDADYYATPGLFTEPHLFGLVSSARATARAITKARHAGA